MAMSQRDMQNQSQNQAVTVHTHAPEFNGFTHTIKNRFFYFLGSAQGNRDSFGMTAAKLAELVTKFQKTFNDSEVKISREKPNLPKFPADLTVKLDACVLEVIDIAKSHKAGTLYTDNSSMAAELHETGHIPVILSSITVSQQYERSTRSVSAVDLEVYFNINYSARHQAKEYLAKQRMMKKISQLYKETSEYRNNIPGGPDYYACTRLMTALETDVIKKNEATMPHEYVQFDLYSEMVKKLLELTNRVNTLDGRDEHAATLVKGILNVINRVKDVGTVDAQKTISNTCYGLLEEFVMNKGIGQTEEFKITKALDQQLQEVLPIAAYLNSEFNPFARDGIAGEIIDSEFHKKALKAYQLHESKEKAYVYGAHEYKYDSTPRTERFDTDQIQQLIFGKEEIPAAQNASTNTGRSMLGSMHTTLLSITSGSTPATVESSQSGIRRQQLALVAPANQLLLMPPQDEENVNVIIPGQGGPKR